MRVCVCLCEIMRMCVLGSVSSRMSTPPNDYDVFMLMSLVRTLLFTLYSIQSIHTLFKSGVSQPGQCQTVYSMCVSVCKVAYR